MFGHKNIFLISCFAKKLFAHRHSKKMQYEYFIPFYILLEKSAYKKHCDEKSKYFFK